MIANDKRKYASGKITKSRSDYYLIMVDNRPMGVCTRFEEAQACAKCYAEEYNAKEVGTNDVYNWDDASGSHYITIQIITRLRMPRNISD